MKDLYQKYPDVMAFFALKDGKLIFDFDDKKISFQEMMLINSNLVSEFVKSVAIAHEQNQEQIKGN